jgi:hypothetical protein
MAVERILLILTLALGVSALFWLILRLQGELDVKPKRRGKYDPWRGRWFDWTDKR